MRPGVEERFVFGEELRSSPVSSLKSFDERDFLKSLRHISDEIWHSPASGLTGFVRIPATERLQPTFVAEDTHHPQRGRLLISKGRLEKSRKAL
jgi:hypothetical protein